MDNIEIRKPYDLNGLSEVERLRLAIQKFKEYDIQRSKQYKLLQTENQQLKIANQSLNAKVEYLREYIDSIISKVTENPDCKATKDLFESLTHKVLMQRNALKQYQQSFSKLKQKLEKQEQELLQIKIQQLLNK